MLNQSRKSSDQGSNRLESFTAGKSESRLQQEAAKLLSSPPESSAAKSNDTGTATTEKSGPQLSKEITEADAKVISNNKEMLAGADADQAAQIVSMNPTGEAMETLVDRDMDKAVELCVQRADVAAVAEHNDDLPDSFHRQYKLATTGMEN